MPATAELASSSIVTASCLPDPETVRSIALGPAGLFANARPRTIHIETSTVGPACVRELDGEAKAQQIRFVDAPVSRGKDDELVMWVGAHADHFDLARPVLEHLADRVVYCGGVGLGQTTKLVNNLIAHALIAVVGEALALGVRSGASLDRLATALQHGTAQNRVLDELFPASVFRGDYRPGLRLDLALKDLDLARELANGSEPATAGPIRDLLEEARSRGWGDLSAHAVVRLIEERTGVELRSLLAEPE